MSACCSLTIILWSSIWRLYNTPQCNGSARNGIGFRLHDVFFRSTIFHASNRTHARFRQKVSRLVESSGSSFQTSIGAYCSRTATGGQKGLCVFHRKFENGSLVKHKAHLVARGFTQVFDVDYNEAHLYAYGSQGRWYSGSFWLVLCWLQYSMGHWSRWFGTPLYPPYMLALGKKPN